MPKANKPAEGVLLDAWGRRNRKLQDKTCPHCGNAFRPHRAESRYCSRSCMWANNGGHNKGTGEGWINARGYRETKVDGRTVKEHRAIVEEATGEKLHPDFDVHHINGDKTDNRLENLEIIPHGEHSSFHNLTRAHRSGYTLNLSQDERLARSLRAADLHKAGKLMPPQALAKARGE